MPLRRLVFGTAAVACTAATLALQPIIPRVPRIDRVELSGQLAPAAAPRGARTITLVDRGRTYRLVNIELKVLTGIRFPADIVADVAPYRPNFFLRGSRTLLDRLHTAPMGAPVVITATLQEGGRDLLVEDVQVGRIAPATPPH